MAEDTQQTAAMNEIDRLEFKYDRRNKIIEINLEQADW